MPWTLRFPFDTVDARVFARQSISELRRDPAVIDIRPTPGGGLAYLNVHIEFLEGHEEPTDRVLTERMEPFLPRPEPPRRAGSMLENFKRHGAFSDKATIKAVAEKLANPDLIHKAKVFPYQLLTAFLNVEDDMPREITNALQDAAEVACSNVPKIEGSVCVFPDVSGSMSTLLTGTRKNPKTGKTEMHMSKVRCIDVAALVAAA